MPGILPMKVIKVGTTTQSRIAQACDRCRSKKIRCDGVTPTCSQCENVGFECKTSDKLSRRAFPRGYTESLEERVRALEGEVRELKDLLDEKDEKIDMLSRIQSNSPQRRRFSSSSQEVVSEAKSEDTEDTFKMQQAPVLIKGDQSDSYFMGSSSGRSFFDAFKTSVQESGKPCSPLDTTAFFSTSHEDVTMSKSSRDDEDTKAPPRLVADQMVNIFFQEWAPLFPVLHKPTFLNLYGEYLAAPESIVDPQCVAQLHLIFSISAVSSKILYDDVASFERQWKPALDSIIARNTLSTLQCLVLAQIYCILKADYDHLLHYNGIAVSISHRLGLHQSQKRFSLGALTSETRKKVFWTLYTLDCFTAALLGLPKHLKDCDIFAEFPSDVDDENVTEKGFQSTLPGESTRVSSALALFRAAQVMSEVLTEIYPSTLSHEISLQKIGMLQDELDTWRETLAPHLRLYFVHDKPSTNVISSRCPLLSLTYYYIRTLIHRPVVVAGIGERASPSVVALADSSKHIIQIVELLEERELSFSFCLNKKQLLFLSSLGLLFQSIDLKQGGKLIRDNQKLVCSAITILERGRAQGVADLKKLACSMMPIEVTSKGAASGFIAQSASRLDSDKAMPAPTAAPRSTRKQLQAIASRFSFGADKSIKENKKLSARRSTAPVLISPKSTFDARNTSNLSVSSIRSEPPIKRATSDTPKPSSSTIPIKTPNLDYLPLFDDPSTTYMIPTATANSMSDTRPTDTISDWDRLLDLLDDQRPRSAQKAADRKSPYTTPGNNDTFLSNCIKTSTPSTSQDWSSDLTWESYRDFETFDPTSTTTAKTCSLLSFSEESLTSGEELSSCDLTSSATTAGSRIGSGNGSRSASERTPPSNGYCRGIAMPNFVEGMGVWDGLDGTFGI
ncbi:hypothetical protein MMC09_000138 [Bachmanniomyces sp. S44760]|nr:hypothetical protein [Bachmanniomyces sp. S44760]